MNKPTLGQNDTIIDTKIESIKRPCNDIGKEKKWSRNCPKCSKEIIYKTKSQKTYSSKINQICKRCSYNSRMTSVVLDRYCPLCNKIIHYRSKFKRSHSEKKNTKCKSCCIKGENHSMYGKHFSKDHRKKLSDSHIGQTPWNRGKHRSSETRLKISKNRSGKYFGSNHHMFGKHHKRESLKKIRLSIIKQLKDKVFSGGQVHPAFNKNACKFIDEYGKQNGLKFQHAMNGGEFFIKELGYWVDRYDKEKNVAFEYDERKHNKFKKKDRHRMNEIKQHLGCKFIRYNETINEIRKY